MQYPFFGDKEESAPEEVSADYFLDITTEVCPLTFIRTKLFVEGMEAGKSLEIRLNAGEPLENVPRSLTELGASVLSVRAETPDQAQGVHRVRIRWNGNRRATLG